MKTIFIIAVNGYVAKQCAQENKLSADEWFYVNDPRQLCGVPPNTTVVWKHSSWFIHPRAAEIKDMIESRNLKVIDK